MSIGPLDDDAVDSYREAGAILSDVMNEARAMVEPGTTHLEVAAYAEDYIREEGAGLAFPVNISIDAEASHATPGRDDETVFGEEMVCLDIGVHVNGYIADAAVTVDHSGTPDLADAAEESLAAAVDAVAPGVEVGYIGGEIEDVITSYGYTPVLNLTGHGVQQYDAHTGPNIPNRGVERSVELEVGQVIAIEPFATDGRGKVTEGTDEEIYEQVGSGSVRDRRARKVLEEIEAFENLPFAARWLDNSRADIALRRLKMANIVKGYPVLKEDDGQLVSQAEHTLIVTEDGCEVTTAGIHSFD
ncbi:type II methionyl aminopeptidase [Natronocalculus amylovorans]|uniref:Methionine aminopeptidase n=1 Tax=Natronocalculus amylovorans TaxID=2917812 RepID=A0AAE3KA90_9EURY|nr:type II methionyl aminopeptidase [Natronocalculus amylovorans]MCL9816704.1 type II methionyl aminopeptidase [Natronocalculus amylovorans]